MKPFWYNHSKFHLNNIEGNQNLADILHDICEIVSNEEKSGYSTADGLIDCRVSRLTGFESCRWIENEELGEKLVELKNEIGKALKEAKAEGLKEGKNLLKLLNQGKITLDELQ
jgi:hypothetical protein